MKQTAQSTGIQPKSRRQASVILRFVAFIYLLLFLTLTCQKMAAQYGEAMEEAEEYFNGLSSDFSSVNDRIDQVTDAYEKLTDCVRGSGDVGKECQKYIDLLYNTAGIEVHDQVMEGKQIMEEMLKQFEKSGVYDQLVSAKRIFSAVGTTLSNSHNALEFANKFNPEGARGDPTRGLNLIGKAIGEAADKLPYPMDEIFKGYSEAVTGISKQLVQLQSNLENARQGNLGGGYAHFADAQAYFENRFSEQDGRDTDLFFDVTSLFPLLGTGVKVFCDYISAESEYYIYEPESGEIGENGWLAPASFKMVYKYFTSLPNRSLVPALFRVQRLVAQARTNPEARVNMAMRYYQDFGKVKNNYNTERLLKELKLLPSLEELLTYGQDTFIGLWLFDDETKNQIQQIANSLYHYVYVEGSVLRKEEDGVTRPASNISVTLDVDGGGRASTATDDNGSYFVYTRGEPNLKFALSAQDGEDIVRETSRFLSRGLDDVKLVLTTAAKLPVTISISPESTNLKAGETATFSASAVFRDNSSIDITSNELTSWSTGTNSFSATDETTPGEHEITVSYMNLEATATVTVSDAEPDVAEEPGDCRENETWDEELNTCVCKQGYEWIEELGECVSLEDAIDKTKDPNADSLCDEKAMVKKLARLRQIIAESKLKEAQMKNLTDQFMKIVNEKTANPCHNQTIATAYSGAKRLEEEFQDYETKATEISQELILEATICGTSNPDFNISSIFGLVEQLGPPLYNSAENIALMESELMTFGCDEREVADRGDAIADVTADPEVTSGMGGEGSEITPPWPSTEGTSGSVSVVYGGTDGPLSSIRISVNLSFTTYNFMVSKEGGDMRSFQNVELGAGDVMQITVSNTRLNASITLLSTDFGWTDPVTQQQTSPGNGNCLFTVVIGVYYDDNENVNRYRMKVEIGTTGMAIPGYPDGFGRELNY